MKIKFLFSAALVSMSALFLSSCCHCKQAALLSSTLEGQKWTLVEYQGRPFQAQDNYHITFSEDNTAAGVADCNSFMSDYEASETGKISVTNKALTRAMCQNDTMEQAFLEMLQSADSFSIDGDLLLWLSNGEVLAVFEAKDFVPSKAEARKRRLSALRAGKDVE
ncbi:MAG: META domain-containing protein [Rikenellaceae bacterium]